MIFQYSQRVTSRAQTAIPVAKEALGDKKIRQHLFKAGKSSKAAWQRARSNGGVNASSLQDPKVQKQLLNTWDEATKARSRWKKKQTASSRRHKLLFISVGIATAALIAIRVR